MFDASIVQVFFTMVIAGATIAYVWITNRMLREMKSTNERLVKPNVHVFLGPGERHSIIFNARIANIGASPVHNLRISVDPPDLPALLSEQIADLNLFQRPVPVLGQGQEISTDLFSFLEVYDEHSGANQIIFHAEYDGVDGNRRSQSFEYDLDVWFGLSAKDIHSLNDVTKVLTSIATNIKSAGDSINKLESEVEWGSRTKFQASATNDLEVEALAFIRLWQDYRTAENKGRYNPRLQSHIIQYNAERLYRCLAEQQLNYSETRILAHSLARTRWGSLRHSRNQMLDTGDELVRLLNQIISEDGSYSRNP